MAEYGAPLTGAQMNLLRAAGMDGGTAYQFRSLLTGRWQNGGLDIHFGHIKCTTLRLPADHPAYTLLEKGWLDKPNVRLWFGGDKAPDDWMKGSEVLLRGGVVIPAHGIEDWGWGEHNGDIIAYIAKDEVVDMRTARMEAQRQDQANILASEADTVTLNTMTEVEARHRIADTDWTEFPVKMHDALATLKLFGLIKSEPTLEERFWEKFPTDIELSNRLKGWVKLALEFERD